MNSATSLLDFILNLLRDPHKQAEFHQHPERMLAEHGLHGVSAHEIHETLPLVTDHRAVQLCDGHGVTSPPPVWPGPGESEHQAAVRYIDHITKVYSYNIDNHSTTIDDSVHENIWASGDVSQTFDDTNVVASGHAVAAGGDISGSNVATGDGSAAGYGNSVLNGSHDVQGDGNVTGHVIGSQVATTGGTNDNHLVSDSGNHLVSDSGNHLVSDSGNTDLHSFGAGATNTIGTDNISATAINSGNSSESHNFSDVGNSSDTSLSSGPCDENGTHFDHGAVGDSYGTDSVAGNCDSHDSAMELHIH